MWPLKNLAIWRLTLQAFWNLLYFDFYLSRGDFSGLYENVRRCPLGEAASDSNTVQRVCSAVDLACIWYWKEVRCLQRSAAGACLLRRSGVAARMVMGAQMTPFHAHAWVEVEGRVVNDKPYIHEHYAVLDRC